MSGGNGVPPARGHLRPLTSLRFVAASMILLLHAAGQFGISQTPGGPFLLWQGVSFFFVLSGFILVYVYGELEGVSARSFLRARIARIWPAHVATLLLLLLLVPTARPPLDAASTGHLLTNIALLQSWTPTGEQWSSFNGVSWSVSAELGFYLCFPLLVINWRRTWHWKLFGTLLLVFLLISLGNAGVFLRTEPVAEGIRNIPVLNVHPLIRLFEFVLGMSAAVLWERLAARRRAGFAVATLWEGLALLLLVVLMYGSAPWAAAAARQDWVGSAGWIWLTNGGIPAGGFAILIVVLALQGGAISRLLSLPLLVLLGEISYSSYLIHQIIIRYAMDHPDALAALPSLAQLGLFLGITLLLSYLCWAFVETPFRALLTGRWQVGARVAAWWARRAGNLGSPEPLSWQRPAARRPPLPAAVVLAALIALSGWASIQTQPRPPGHQVTSGLAEATQRMREPAAGGATWPPVAGGREPGLMWRRARPEANVAQHGSMALQRPPVSRAPAGRGST
ncbi:MAG: acyltransferase [Thermomicrobiales bacterium]